MTELNETLVMTTCKCRENEKNLVMSRQYLDDLIKLKTDRQNIVTIDKVIDLLAVHHDVWFHQSLTAGSSAFWNNKVATVKQLMNQLEEMKCQN
jgi:hypothetical protein